MCKSDKAICYISSFKASAIFQVLKHLNDFQRIGCGGHFVYQYATKTLHRCVSIAINIPCKFEDIVISDLRNKGLCENITNGWMHARRHGRMLLVGDNKLSPYQSSTRAPSFSLLAVQLMTEGWRWSLLAL